MSHGNHDEDACGMLSVEEVSIAISKLRSGKTSGSDNLTVEHILNTHSSVVVCIGL